MSIEYLISYQPWKCGNVEIWKCLLTTSFVTNPGSVEMWKCGNLEMSIDYLISYQPWKCGNVEIWKFGNVY